MLSPYLRPSVDDLLTVSGLAGISEEPFPTDGWSGATFTLLRRPDGRRFVVKRDSLATDWIARATRDETLRESVVATGLLPMPAPAWAPYLGAARDGAGTAILMPDLSGALIRWDRREAATVDEVTLERVLTAAARLHAAAWARPEVAGPGAGFPWCPLRERLLLLAPPAAERYRAEGLPAGERFLAGWAAFRRLAPPLAAELVDRLAADPTSLLTALDRLPSAGLHGDLKLANVGLTGDGRVVLIDWGMLTLAPVAVELGWFLVSNSGALPLAPEQVLARYRDVADPAVLGDWDAQADLAWIVGLLLRGWRKGLDMDAGIILGSGIPAAEDLAWWCARAVEAAGRRL